MHKEYDVTKIRELLGISANKRANRARRTMYHKQRRKSSGTLRLIDDNAYVFVLRVVIAHYSLDERLRPADTNCDRTLGCAIPADLTDCHHHLRSR